MHRASGSQCAELRAHLTPRELAIAVVRIANDYNHALVAVERNNHGYGVIGHLHLHALPRWMGDSNFMTVAGETRVLAEDLAITYDRFLKALA